MPNADSQYRTLRIVHLAMIAGAVIIIFLAEFLIRPQPSKVQPVLLILFTLLAVVDIAIAIFLRQRMFGRSRSQLQAGSDGPALATYMTANVLGFAFAYSAVLFGFMLRMIGGSVAHAVAIYLLGLVFLVTFSPKPLSES